MGADLDTGKKGSRNVNLNIVPFIDLMSCLTAFLLVTAVWSNLSQIDIEAKGGVMAVPYLEEAHHFSDVRVVGVLLGIVLMLPSSLYERFVTQRRGGHDVSNIVEHFLPRPASNTQRREFAARDLVGILLCIGVLVFLAYYVIVVVIFIVDCTEAIDHDIDTFWDTLEWTGWGLLIGLGVCQIAILWSAALKASCFAGSDLSGCQRTGESLFVDLRTSIIFNDYRALKARFPH